MRDILAAAAAAAICAACFGVGTAQAEPAPVDGLWRTEKGESGAYLHVRIAACDGAPATRCGVVEEAFGVEDPDRVLGRGMIFDMAPEGGGAWGGGEIWAPDDDRRYGASMALEAPDALKVEGCVLFFCRGQRWARVE